MSSIKVVSADDVPTRASRPTKTAPLREKISSLTPESSLFVLYYNEEVREGYKKATIAQVAGQMTRDSDQYRYSIQAAPAVYGCYIICKEKS